MRRLLISDAHGKPGFTHKPAGHDQPAKTAVGYFSTTWEASFYSLGSTSSNHFKSAVATTTIEN